MDFSRLEKQRQWRAGCHHLNGGNGERERAREIAQEALAKYGGTVRGDDLRRTLATFERAP